MNQQIFALDEDIRAFTGFTRRDKLIEYLDEKKVKYHINGQNEIKVPLVEIQRALGLESEAPAEVKLDWINEEVSGH